MAYDIPIPGYANKVVNNLRLWQSKSTQDVDFKSFQSGDYISAMRRKVKSEAISKFLYPNDDNYSGKLLRLKQQYFFVSATLQDIVRIHKRQHKDLSDLPEKVVIQLNDTHPSIAIPELMRILVDEERMPWDLAWDITRRTFAYTNHTVMAEALERWPVSLMESLLPRHMQIIYDINQGFLAEVRRSYPGDVERLRRMSIIEEGPEKRVRMSHLAIVGSFAVNGVAELHTRILKEKIFPDFEEFYPGKIINITNGITPRRWLAKANPILSEIITSRIGEGWALDLSELRALEKHADDAEFVEAWMSAKWSNKHALAAYIKDTMDVDVDVGSMFDVQIKRIHEYKRQLMNVMHVIALYNAIRENPKGEFTPRTVLMAKLIIKLITSVAETINEDPATRDLLKVLFLRNYSVSLAEKIIPAADLSEQISTAGTEASGTGNMKLALNGALTIGTMDGANIEIARDVGRENMFIFGLTEPEIEDMRRRGYDPRKQLGEDPMLARVVEMIRDDYFNWREPGIFKPIVDSLLGGDRFFVLADFAQFVAAQRDADRLFRDKAEWAKRAILTTARMGRFSSDRTVAEYSKEIWDIKPEKC